MFFSEHQRYAGSGALSVTASAATLTQLRQQSFPRLIAAPEFAGGARALPASPDWLQRVQASLERYLSIAAAIAAIGLIIALLLPTVAAIQSSAPPASLSTARSSAGVTGTTATRVDDLGVASFVGGVPFVQQSRYLSTRSGAVAPAPLFVASARQASVADYIQNIGEQVALPYLSATATTTEAIRDWTAAVAATNLTSVQSLSPALLAWQAPALAPGTVIPGTVVTFYSCIGSGFCGLMANGQQVFDGAAACSYGMPYGTRFFINNDPASRVYTCLDRGALAAPWVDIWFYDPADGWAWQAQVGGTSSAITIVE
ncbi:MAG: hypothetical protein IH866_00485 [Chloroflexi bacterium]|nr:hypothetical protein [Chloroflexota bacterium]